MMAQGCEELSQCLDCQILAVSAWQTPHPLLPQLLGPPAPGGYPLKVLGQGQGLLGLSEGLPLLPVSMITAG